MREEGDIPWSPPLPENIILESCTYKCTIMNMYVITVHSGRLDLCGHMLGCIVIRYIHHLLACCLLGSVNCSSRAICCLSVIAGLKGVVPGEPTRLRGVPDALLRRFLADPGFSSSDKIGRSKCTQEQLTS